MERPIDFNETPTWLAELLDDDSINDVCMNGYDEIFVDRGNRLESIKIQNLVWNEEDLRNWVLSQLSAVGKSWDARHPFVDATLLNGFRIHVAFPPIARKGILVSLRKLPKPRNDCRWTSSPLYQDLVGAIRRGESIIISGATGSGKTTLANDLLSEVPANERIIALEDTPELAPTHPHFVSLISRPPNSDGCGEVTLRTLLRQTLRMRPDRVVLGECRGAEVMELLQALNTGHRGALATLHANSPRDALRRIELLCLIASSGSIPIGAIRELLSVGIQWIAQVKRLERKRLITELWHLEGREGDTILMRPIVN